MNRFRHLIVILLFTGCFLSSNAISHEQGITDYQAVKEVDTSDAAFQQLKTIRSAYLDQEIPMIDMHLHTGTFLTMGPIGQQFLIDALNLPLPNWLVRFLLAILSLFQLNPYGAGIGIQTECYKAGMSACFLFAVYAPDTWGTTTNAFVTKYLDDNRNTNQTDSAPFFFGFASLDQSNWDEEEAEQLDNLSNALDHPYMLGVKMAFIHNTIPFDDTRFDVIYDLAAEKGVPVYHHTGSSPLRDLEDFESDEEQQ